MGQTRHAVLHAAWHASPTISWRVPRKTEDFGVMQHSFQVSLRKGSSEAEQMAPDMGRMHAAHTRRCVVVSKEVHKTLDGVL